MPEPVIRADNVNKHFESLRAVCALSFAVPAGTCFGFLGPNGAGKTTLMKMIYARSRRDRGSHSVLTVFGYDPDADELSIKYLSGVVPQEDNLDEELNVLQNLLLFARFYAIPLNEAKRRSEELLDFLELSEKRTALIRDLSGGMKRRLVIARALLNRPRLLILDEPTTGLDPQVRHLIWNKLRQLKRRGTTMLLTTHYMEEAFQLCDQILIMHEGRKVMQDSPRALLASHIEKFVLEIQDADDAGAAIPETLPAGVRGDRTGDALRLYANEMDALKAAAERLGEAPYFLRQTNLEDVFLRATGRILNERQ